MGAELDLDDVAATSKKAQKELAGLRAQVGDAINPRYLLWCVWHGNNPNMRLWDFMDWIKQRWSEFSSASNDHAIFDEWLLDWTRREISNKVTYE